MWYSCGTMAKRARVARKTEKRPPTFSVPLRHGVADAFRDFCRAEKINQVDMIQMVLEYFMGLDQSLRQILLDQVKREDQPRFAFMVLERIARSDPDASYLAREVLERIANDGDVRAAPVKSAG